MQDILRKIEKYPIIPIYYHDDVSLCIKNLDACYKGGIRIFEFVNRGSQALENFEILLKHKNKEYADLALGIGTIKNQNEALDFINLGAEFIVSPIVNPAIAEVTLKKNLLWIPGCMTPTEIALAEELHAPLVKLFPGDSLGPKFLNAIKPLFPKTKFMPTGGVSLDNDNLKGWFKSGVTAVGLGSKLFEKPNDITSEEWLENRLKELFKMIATY